MPIKNLNPIILLLFLTACSASIDERDNLDQQKNDTKQIVATNYPLFYFASRIAGEKAEVIFPVDEDVDPAFWHPESKDIEAIQKTDLIIINGAAYESWLSTVSLPKSKIHCRCKKTLWHCSRKMQRLKKNTMLKRTKISSHPRKRKAGMRHR